MKWANKEILELTELINNGETYVTIGQILNRSSTSVQQKARRLGLFSSYNKKTEEQYIKQLPESLILIGRYTGDKVKTLHKHNCGYTWLVKPNAILNGVLCPGCYGTSLKTAEFYETELPKDIIVLEKYINNKTKILHKHVLCNYEWLVAPSTIIQGHSCPKCYAAGFNQGVSGYTYCVYFPDLKLYKIGITNNINKRIKAFGYKCELVLLRYFNLGKNAQDLEKIWLNNINKYKLNTGLLTSGNTETFTYND